MIVRMTSLLQPSSLTVLVGLTVLLQGCLSSRTRVPDDEEEQGESEPPSDPHFVFGESQNCDSPVEGSDRFDRQDLSGQIDVLPTLPQGMSIGYVVAEDLDGDTDIDLVLATEERGGYALYLNNGDGVFERADALPLLGGSPVEYGPIAAADLDGDGLADLVHAHAVGSSALRNLGNGVFDDPVPLTFQQPETASWVRIPSLSLGDADGDGDLDLALFGAETWDDLDAVEKGNTALPTRDQLVLLNGFEVETVIELNSVGTLGLVGTFTDRDHDGDFDLLIPSDLLYPLVFWRNDGLGEDGLPIFVDDAPAISANLPVRGMGVDSWDFNGDGLLDYCITDIGDPDCLISDPSGHYVESGQNLGLITEDPQPEESTVGWQIELIDLDADGAIDAYQPAGPMGWGVGSDDSYPDLLWWGDGQGGFVDHSQESGLDDRTAHYGGAAADFDGDGFLDLIAVPNQGLPALWKNRCSSGSWLQVRLDGAPENRSAIGARVEVDTGQEIQIREIQTQRGQGQRPNRAYFGLGTLKEVRSLRVEWPDGEIIETGPIGTRRSITALHPHWVPEP